MLFFVGENGKCEYKDGRKLVLKACAIQHCFAAKDLHQKP